MALTMLSISFTDLYGQYCPNTTWTTTAWQGIQTNGAAAAKPFEIHGEPSCTDVSLLLNYQDLYKGYLSLLTPGHLDEYTSVFSRDTGDIVLSSPNTTYGGNLILQIRDEKKKIIFGTRSLIQPNPDSLSWWHQDIERQKINTSGRIDFNIGNWNHGLGKITLFNHNGNPTIKLYRPTGMDPTVDGESYPFWIESSGYCTGTDCADGFGTLLYFKSGQVAKIGAETTQTIMTLRLDTRGNPNNLGYVGINNTMPIAGFQVTDKNVLFNGDTGSVPMTGAGTRFMWIPEKAAIRAGRIEGAGATLWNYNYNHIGDYSVAMGLNCEADGDYSLAIGTHCYANGIASIALGYSSVAGGNASWGGGPFHNAHAIGYNAYASKGGAKAFGNSVTAEGESSTAMGNYVKTTKYGSFIIGDGNQNRSTTKYYNESKIDNINQLTLKFTGNANMPNSSTNLSVAIITETDTAGKYYNGMFLLRGGNGDHWSSDSSLKKNIQSVDEYDLLCKLRQVPIKTWQWKDHWAYADTNLIWDSVSYQWMGPMAQDFHSQFPIGCPDSTILSESVMNAAMFAGIQSLANITDTLKYGIERSWGLSGNSATTGDFIGTTNSFPLIFKTNSTERMQISDNQIICHSYGGDGEEHPYIIYTSSGEGIYTYLAADGTGWFSISDKNKKENFSPVDNNKILESIDRIPVTTWNFKQTPLDKRYMGPMAQDFYREFPLWGKDSLAINSVIFDGVNFAGIKALINRTGNMQKQIDASLSKAEFNKFKDSIVLKTEFITFKDSVVKNDVFISFKDSVVKKEDFNSFRDSISCLKDACDKIKEMEDKIKDLQTRLDSLENKPKFEGKKDQNKILSINYDDIILEQNNPNPFAETSEINYYIPAKYNGKARLVITDENGLQILQKFDACNGKPCQITISAKELQTGVYLYGIVLNGNIVKSKKLMIIK
ncbi:MAG: hypothetical protein HW421_3531 [Ignavibacteria bacterium]|nr:hypothetical protein [Ignavibacteria bacterium]